MATQIAKAHVFGLGTFVCKTIAGVTIGGNSTGGSLSHESEVDKIKGLDGEVTSLIAHGDSLACEFNMIPEATTQAGAKVACNLPATLTGVSIGGLPIVASGPFSDALNTNGSNTQPWVYEGGGKINLSNSEKWTMTLPLKRYYGITDTTGITT
jgi:hypothetical protein